MEIKIPFKDYMAYACIMGFKTETRRYVKHGNKGDLFEVVLPWAKRDFILTNVYRQKLGDMTLDNVKAEGVKSFEMFRDLWCYIF